MSPNRGSMGGPSRWSGGLLCWKPNGSSYSPEILGRIGSRSSKIITGIVLSLTSHVATVKDELSQQRTRDALTSLPIIVNVQEGH